LHRIVEPQGKTAMRLYCHPASTTSRIVMMYAAENEPALEFETVDLFTGEHLKPAFAAINPSCLVPVLEDGDFRLTESSAIVKYLADKARSPAYPTELRRRARVNERMDWFNTNFYRDFAYGLVYPQLFPTHRRPTDDVQAGTLEWGKQRSLAWFAILENHLLPREAPFLTGENVTIADYLGAEMVAIGELIRCDFSRYPNVRRWLANVKALPSWPKVHQVFDGLVKSLSEKTFVSI
jgi:glutathione S-transferase